MTSHMFTIPDLSESDADAAISDFVSDGCTAIKAQQPDGKWSVVATCPLSAPPGAS